MSKPSLGRQNKVLNNEQDQNNKGKQQQKHEVEISENNKLEINNKLELNNKLEIIRGNNQQEINREIAEKSNLKANLFS